MKHMVQCNWIIRPNDIISVVRVMIVSVNLHEINKEKVDRVGKKFVLKNFRRWLIPVIRPSSSLLVKGS